MFRHKKPERAATPRPKLHMDSMLALREAYFGVIRAFLADQPSAGLPNPAPIASPEPGTAAFGAEAAPSGFVYGIMPFVNGDTPLGVSPRPNSAMDIPGAGPVSHAQLQQVEARLEPLLIELFGPGGIQNLSSVDFASAYPNLDAIRARGAVNDEQFNAIRAAMLQFQQLFGT